MIDLQGLQQYLVSDESLACEFKSDRNRLSDSVIYEEVVALANTDGGILLIGVEDDGSVTGTIARHGSSTDPRRLQATIFNNTVPSINTRASILQHPQGEVIAIEVDSYPEPCATASPPAPCVPATLSSATTANASLSKKSSPPALKNRCTTL